MEEIARAAGARLALLDRLPRRSDGRSLCWASKHAVTCLDMRATIARWPDEHGGLAWRDLALMRKLRASDSGRSGALPARLAD